MISHTVLPWREKNGTRINLHACTRSTNINEMVPCLEKT